MFWRSLDIGGEWLDFFITSSKIPHPDFIPQNKKAVSPGQSYYPGERLPSITIIIRAMRSCRL